VNLDEARVKVHARQEHESTEMAKAHARERAALEVDLLRMTDRHRREFIELGRRQIAERDFMSTARPTPPAEGRVTGQGDRGGCVP
jgi:hypothetical protein